MSAIPLSQLASSKAWQTNFLSVLPAVTTHARVRFRHLPAYDKAEAVSETVARACVDYAGLARRRKLHRVFAGTLATYAAQAVGAGRRVGGHVNSKDVLSEVAQKKRGIAVDSLTPWSPTAGKWRDLLLESRKVNPAEQACFNLDFTAWIKTFSHRHRALIKALASGCTTTEVAMRFHVTLGRISQLRRTYAASWMKFQGETVPELAA